eukprot:CAMPEP_0202901446 /NCGR_PEP_ID=MMETSP1392-20130828/14256_1 /ASSEMBLY_ACC=CAM_ASM_000868 /TAXON_ID=225041 /ORGANISM="Chlamydomonas chlamydogama, Strain SAG 11-48b" /LENGTH=139 /DNA_ID=CAMNT_0049588005 /DNA_START=570 /DNA_END=989 /DNA_ORIENTATION=+
MVGTSSHMYTPAACHHFSAGFPLLVSSVPGCHLVPVHFCDGGEVQAAQLGQVSRHPQLVVLELCNRVAMQGQLHEVLQLGELEHVTQVADLVAVKVQHLEPGELENHILDAVYLVAAGVQPYHFAWVVKHMMQSFVKSS